MDAGLHCQQSAAAANPNPDQPQPRQMYTLKSIINHLFSGTDSVSLSLSQFSTNSMRHPALSMTKRFIYLPWHQNNNNNNDNNNNNYVIAMFLSNQSGLIFQHGMEFSNSIVYL